MGKLDQMVKCFHKEYGLILQNWNSTDNNLIVCGSMKGAAGFAVNDDSVTMDAFVMRLSETGYVEWLT